MNADTKTCFKCGSVKPLHDFYAHPQMRDGRLNKCKECARRDVIKNRASNPEHYKRYDKARANNPERISARKAYMQTDNGRLSHCKSLKKCRDKCPEKTAARNELRKAIIDKRIIRPGSCSVCGIACIPHGHHYDYTIPLGVIWVCSACHASIHRWQNKPIMSA